MGGIRTRLTLENVIDRGRALEGRLDAANVRTAAVEALVDTGAVALMLPEEIVDQLPSATRGSRSCGAPTSGRRRGGWPDPCACASARGR